MIVDNFMIADGYSDDFERRKTFEEKPQRCDCCGDNVMIDEYNKVGALFICDWCYNSPDNNFSPTK